MEILAHELADAQSKVTTKSTIKSTRQKIFINHYEIEA